MSDLERRSGSRPSRRQREQRAYTLVMAGGVAGLVAVVTGLLALFSSFTWSIPILAAILAVLCLVLFRRAVR
jgi:membrane protein implicated in regulation of membrane protease activity